MLLELTLVRQSERYDLVCGAMVGPKEFAVKRERATRKTNTRQVFHLRRFFARIEPRNAPILVGRFLSAQDIDQSIDEHMAADFGADINDAQNVPARIEFENAMLVPLTKVEMIVVEAEV